MMSAATILGRRLGNQLYKVAFPIYRPLYSAFKTYTDRAERRLLASHVSQGCVAVDAGANIGIYSKFLSRCVGPRGIVHSFEPSPDNFSRLRGALAHFPNVRVNQLGLGDTTEESLLHISDDLNVDHRTYPTGEKLRRTVSIQSIALDDYFKPNERVDLIKMDIQGYELHALRGAKRVLMDNLNVKLLLEFWPHGLRKAGTPPEAMLAFLRDLHFTVFFSTADGLLPCDQLLADSADPTIYLNLFAQR
jgi:FkbM family methyltransferase